MIIRQRFESWSRAFLYLGQHPAGQAGVVLTTSAAITLLLFWIYEIVRAGPIHPYTGIAYFLVLPSIFVLGLLLIPLGILLQRRRLRASGEAPSVYPRIDLHHPFARRALTLILILTFINVSVMGVATYKGVQHMDSPQFCGATCHTVMEPQFTAYQGSSHSRVACVECHIGPGAPWFVRSKLSGVRQVFAVTFETYSRPIPSPVHELRPARETCEHCHWPQKFEGDLFWVRNKFADDEKNTRTTTALVLKVGGRTWQGRTGIHGRHLDIVERISYVATDGKRQVIPRVTYIDDDGKTIEYVSTEIKATAQQLAAGERRVMDCMDCHNRPTHEFQLPERAVDQAMAEGRINPELPYIKKKAIEVLRADYPDRSIGTQRIAAALTDFYRASYPVAYREQRAQIELAVQQIQGVYLRNVFPHMKVTWGTYPTNMGHEDFLGCFRCHDGNHTSADGRTISQDCNTCHSMLAMDEANPKILADLGLK